MDRKNFLKSSFMTALGVSLVSKFQGAESSGSTHLTSAETATARDLNHFLRSLVHVDEPSVDRIVIGDPGTKINKIGTCWQPDWNTLRQAASEGVNVMVVHEPTFYTHWDLDNPVNDFYRSPEHGRNQYVGMVETKKKWITDNKMVIIRCHDVWDKMNYMGIPFALGKALGFETSDILAKETYYNVYKLNETRAIDVARNIAQRLKQFNQPGIAFYGDENCLVSSIGIGTGYICDPLNFSHLEPDMVIAIHDTVRTWVQTSFAKDSGKPLLVIDHGTSEEAGMIMLSDFLKKTISGKEVVHFAQGCTFQWVV